MNRRFLPLLGPAFALALFATDRDAEACGGCVVPPDEVTQVTGHRMILSASKTQTTLYDQIEYAGNPESFAWFLPIKGVVDVGLSSDAMFAFLGDESQVVVYPPPLKCASNFRGGGDVAQAESSSGEQVNVAPEEEVNVIAQEVVGPYETVQLEATNPDALTDWLTSHGYGVPDDVKPIIAAYQQEGFGFLAMKLVPGEGVRSMRPVRVTTPGAGLALPLRMVAAGTGYITPVTLYVISEGRYEVAGRPNMRVSGDQLIWDWNENISNYRFLRDDMVDDTAGWGWLTESSGQFYKSSLSSRVSSVIQNNPGTTGWGDPDNGVSETDDAAADMDILFAGMDDSTTWLTRMYARLSRPALAEDLVLGASEDQEMVSRYLLSEVAIGTPPACSSDFSCAVRPSPAREPGLGALGGAAIAVALAWARRRRARRAAS